MVYYRRRIIEHLYYRKSHYLIVEYYKDRKRKLNNEFLLLLKEMKLDDNDTIRDNFISVLKNMVEDKIIDVVKVSIHFKYTLNEDYRKQIDASKRGH